MIAIIDYGMGNLGSIRNMLAKIGAAAAITADAGEIARCERIILPGVGAFDRGMGHLRDRGLVALLEEQVLERKKPFLGICLGMQLLTERSEEGALPGLGWIPGETVRFRIAPTVGGPKVPHMGWNGIAARSQDCLFHGAGGETAYYFVHSYHVVCKSDAHVLAEAEHGYRFCCAVRRDNIAGTQFHPEKSHKHGMRLLRNFIERI